MRCSCSFCGATVEVGDDDGPPIGWSMTVERNRTTYQCPDCVRTNIRAIEGKLSEDWW